MRSDVLEAVFDTASFEITSLSNLATSEKIALLPMESFRIGLESGRICASECARTLLAPEKNAICVEYLSDAGRVEVSYTFAPRGHFIQKRLIFRPRHHEACLIRRLDLQVFGLPGFDGVLVPFQHGQCRTYFLRTTMSSFMFGIQVPVLDAEQNDTARLVIGHDVNYRLLPGEEFKAEILFWGTCRLAGRLAPPVPRVIKECFQSERPLDLGESGAMLELVKGRMEHKPAPPVVSFNGCQNNTSLDPYDEAHAAGVEQDREIAFRAKTMLGKFHFQPNSTWAGAHHAVHNLKSTDTAIPEMPVRKAFFNWARQEGMTTGIMVNIRGAGHYAYPPPHELPGYCADKPEWRGVLPGKPVKIRGRDLVFNCPANRPFIDWLIRILVDDIRRSRHGIFLQDDSLPAPRCRLVCNSDSHDHLPGDASYGAFISSRRLFQALRREFPDLVLNGERPQQDWGIWGALYLDSLFTMSEMIYDKTSDADMIIRTWSRIRHYYHFVPPSMDEVPVKHLAAENLDYTMMSILAVSRNYLFCDMPAGWPASALAKIRHWLDWARERPELMLDSHFLPDWPGQGRCDGYVRCAGEKGVAFFFNANNSAAEASLPLDSASGLEGGRGYVLSLERSTAPLACFDAIRSRPLRGEFVFSMPRHSAAMIAITLAD